MTKGSTVNDYMKTEMDEKKGGHWIGLDELS